MLSIKAAAINIILVCASHLKHFINVKLNYIIFIKVAKPFKSIASSASTPRINLNTSKLLSNIALDGVPAHTVELGGLLNSACSIFNAIGRRYEMFDYRYLLNLKIFCTPGNICECNFLAQQ
jgi:hypothetical protein